MTEREFMSIIETLNNYISTDVIQDGEFKKATRVLVGLHGQGRVQFPGSEFVLAAGAERTWAAAAPGQNPTGPPTPPATAQNKAQIAMAVADANCTLSSDLAGIYFAVQANYEQQFVSASKQALDAGVRQYKAAFAKELKALPALLRTTSATPNLPGPIRRSHHAAAKPSPSHS